MILFIIVCWLQVDSLTLRFLSADRDWCFKAAESTADKDKDFLNTERGRKIREVLSRAVDLCFQGRTYLINCVLRHENKEPAKQKRIAYIYGRLMQFSENLARLKIGRKEGDWEKCLGSVDTYSDYLLFSLKNVGFSNYKR